MRDQLAKTQDELSLTKASNLQLDLDNVMTQGAKVSELNQEIVKLQQTNMSLQAELDSVKLLCGE